MNKSAEDAGNPSNSDTDPGDSVRGNENRTLSGARFNLGRIAVVDLTGGGFEVAVGEEPPQ